MLLQCFKRECGGLGYCSKGVSVCLCHCDGSSIDVCIQCDFAITAVERELFLLTSNGLACYALLLILTFRLSWGNCSGNVNNKILGEFVLIVQYLIVRKLSSDIYINCNIFSLGSQMCKDMKTDRSSAALLAKIVTRKCIFFLKLIFFHIT